MQGKKTVDWSSVDWSKQNRDIAEQYQVSAASVSLVRKQLRKPQPKLRYERKNSQARLGQWRKLDWRETNAAIGLYPRAISCLERVKASLDQTSRMFR